MAAVVLLPSLTDLLHSGRKLQTQLDDFAFRGREVVGAGQRRPGRETATQQLTEAATCKTAIKIPIETEEGEANVAN